MDSGARRLLRGGRFVRRAKGRPAASRETLSCSSPLPKGLREMGCERVDFVSRRFFNIRKISRRRRDNGKVKPRAVFFDRDGTLIENVGFLRAVPEVSFYPQTIPALRRLRDFVLFIVTNQSGIAK